MFIYTSVCALPPIGIGQAGTVLPGFLGKQVLFFLGSWASRYCSSWVPGKASTVHFGSLASRYCSSWVLRQAGTILPRFLGKQVLFFLGSYAGFLGKQVVSQ